MAPSEPPRRNVYKTTEGGSYPCEKCGRLRTKAEGGTTFAVCDECWHPGVDEIADQAREIEALKAELARAEAGQSDEATLMTCIIRNLPERRAEIGKHLLGTEWDDLRARVEAAPADWQAVDRVKAEIEALKAERDEWRKRVSYLHGNHLVMSEACRQLNKAVHRLRRGRDNAIKARDSACPAMRKELARLEGLIASVYCRFRGNPNEAGECISHCSDSDLHAEARAIKARQK